MPIMVGCIFFIFYLQSIFTRIIFFYTTVTRTIRKGIFFLIVIHFIPAEEHQYRSFLLGFSIVLRIINLEFWLELSSHASLLPHK